MIMEARCGHVEEKLYADAHHGLCRKCHSNFAFLLELEQKFGEDALIENRVAKGTHLFIIRKKNTRTRLLYRSFN